MPTLTMDRKRYRRDDNRCIFCAYEFSKLTVEHIIPEAIHGSLILSNAACELCRRYTSEKIDNRALNRDLLIPRMLLSLRGKKGNLQNLELRHLPPIYRGNVTEDASKGSERVLDLPVSSYPQVFSLPVYPTASITSGVNRRNPFDGLQCQFFALGASGASGVTVEQQLSLTPFALMLAKIAYCFTVAERGLDGFSGNEIRDLLLGRRSDVFSFVGSGAATRPSQRSNLHSIELVEAGGLITVVIHLFASCAAPGANYCPYQIVIGGAAPSKAIACSDKGEGVPSPDEDYKLFIYNGRHSSRDAGQRLFSETGNVAISDPLYWN